jgi:hypothetical protein
MKSRDLTTKVKAQIVGMKQVGVRGAQIALEFGMPQLLYIEYSKISRLETQSSR